MNQKLKNLDSTLVFTLTSVVIILNLISVIFPALILRLTSGSGLAPIDPFELGVFAIPLLVVNLIFFSFFFLYKKNLLPRFFYTLTKLIINFDISNKKAILILFLIVSIYAIFSFQELFEAETWPDYARIIDAYNVWHSEDIDLNQIHTKMFFLTISHELFNNFKVLPFLASISLLIITYFFTVQISSKNISGIIAVIIVIQSTIFHFFDTTPTYSNFWVLFFILSLYLVKKSWPFSSLSFIISFFAKALSLAYFPLSILYILHTSISAKKKLLTISSYVIVVAILGILVFGSSDSELGAGNLHSSNFSFHPPKFFSGFSIFPLQLRFDIFIVLLLMPLNFLLFLKSRQGVKHAQSIQIMISGILLTGPILTGFFDYVINPYRLVPMIIFFAIGFGLLFQKIIFQKPIANNL